MADIVDDAQAVEEAFLAQAIRATAVGPKLNPKGVCYYCEGDLDNPLQLFCDCDCEKDYRKLEYARKQRPVL